MKSIKSMFPILTAILILYSVVAPNSARAEEIIANNSSTATCSSTATPRCYTTIQAAIDEAYDLHSASTTSSYTVLVEPGSYQEALNLKGITVRGRETARTILSGGGSGTLVTANTTSTSFISNLTFYNASIGVSASNNAILTIENNIFRNVNTAVMVQTAPLTSITNNVFYSNGKAISTDADRAISNNIILSNTTAIDTTQTSMSSLTNNDIYSNTDAVAWTGNIASDPLFVDPSSSTPDFHLQSGSPCIGTGSGSLDMGAYGGSYADTIPFKVSGVTAALDSTTNNISVSWNKNLDYKVVGYKVYYGKTSGGPYDGTGATEGSSPISVTTGTTESILSGLTSTVSKPGQPQDLKSSPLNESLDLSWSAVDGATSYNLYWSASNFDISSLPTDSVSTESASYRITGLTNGTDYYMAVAAVAEPSYYIAVTALYATTGTTAGVSNESTYSNEVASGNGNAAIGDLSTVIMDYPEELVAYPNLTSHGHGCFIATAAFGYYSAPEVQALREFRDHYLLTNGPGRAFVRWYYEHGPVAAAWLDAHPAYKPVIRAALMPAVGAALVMTQTPFLIIKTALVLFILTIALTLAYRFSRKKLSGPGGSL